MGTNEETETAILLQPTRFKIALHLANASEPEYIERIADAVGENPRLVSHHLEMLEDMGLVTSEFQIIEGKNSGRGFAGRFFTPLPKLKESLQGLADLAAPKKREYNHEK